MTEATLTIEPTEALDQDHAVAQAARRGPAWQTWLGALAAVYILSLFFVLPALVIFLANCQAFTQLLASATVVRP